MGSITFLARGVFGSYWTLVLVSEALARGRLEADPAAREALVGEAAQALQALLSARAGLPQLAVREAHAGAGYGRPPGAAELRGELAMLCGRVEPLAGAIAPATLAAELQPGLRRTVRTLYGDFLGAVWCFGTPTAPASKSAAPGGRGYARLLAEHLHPIFPLETDAPIRAEIAHLPGAGWTEFARERAVEGFGAWLSSAP